MTAVVHYLDLADYLLIAEAALGIDADVLAKAANLSLAPSALDAPAAEFGGVEFYPDLPTKVAVLCVHVVMNHALPDGNKRTGLLCAIEFAERNGYEWRSPPGDAPDGDETVRLIEGVAAGKIDVTVLAAWVADRLAPVDR